MPCRQNIDCTNQISVSLETAFHADKAGLRGAVRSRYVAAARAGSARVLRWHSDEMPAAPCQLVCELAAKLAPALIEDGLVQTSLSPNVLAGASMLPAADLDMFRTCKSSMHTIAWFLLTVVEVLCR
jgi:hypothetical protein